MDRTSDGVPLRTDGEIAVNVERMGRIPLEPEHQDGGTRSAGQGGRESGAGHAQIKSENENGVAHDVEQVAAAGDQHGQAGVAGGAKQGGGRAVQRDEGIGQGGDKEVDQGGVHDRRLHRAEK